MPASQNFNALPSSDTDTVEQENNSVIADVDTADASSDNSSGRLVLLAGLVAVAAVVLIASGGFGGLKERVKVRAIAVETCMHSMCTHVCESDCFVQLIAACNGSDLHDCAQSADCKGQARQSMLIAGFT
jgi:hypothetical protein